MDKYTLKKLKNQGEVMKSIKKYISDSTFERIDQCGSYLLLLGNATLEKKKLAKANFCGNRFCPMCAWRLAKKDALKIAILMKYIEMQHKKKFIFLTLTAPNVTGDDLKLEITKYNAAFKKLTERKEVRTAVKGYIRKLEITYNQERRDFHPHFHVLIAVNTRYFTDKTYIKQEKWLALWRNAMQDDTITQVHVQKVTDQPNDNGVKESSAVLELAKYASKDADYLQSEEVFGYFYKALKGRQVLTFNGLFAEANKLYKAGELDHLKEIDQTEWVYWLLYTWGFGSYIEEEKRELTEDEKRKYNKQLLDEAEDVE
jgi:plasmid rolling circle replication initiator protein Rep